MMPENKSFTPRFGRPLKLPKHSVSMFADMDILPENIIWKDSATSPVHKAFIAKYVAKHELTKKMGFVYVVRVVTLRLPPLPPPQLLGN